MPSRHLPRLLLLLVSALPVAAQDPGADPRAAALAQGLGALGEQSLEDRLRAAAHADWSPGVPEELFVVERVVDGDTIHVQRNGERQKLRLLSVDTEEKITGRADAGGSKPETVYGQESADWAVRFFADLADDEGVTRVGLHFPGDIERRDVYGRVLCHVVLADGTDFNLLLVALGRSPYFNKYGNSEVCDDAFRKAQTRALEARIGVWDPAINLAADGAPSARRPYDRLLPWWEARARAVDSLRSALAAGEAVASAEEPDQLAALLEGERREVRVFGSIFRSFEEDDGSQTLLFRTGFTDRAFRARVAARDREQLDSSWLESSTEEFQQNYLWVSGTLEADRQGFQMRLEGADRIEPAGPSPEELARETEDEARPAGQDPERRTVGAGA
jgi:endonuclease YncB( thermonuclease family)